MLPLAAGIIHAAPSTTPPAWVAGITPGTWAAISRNTMSDVDPAKDPAVNPNYPDSPPWNANSGQRAVLTTWNGGALASGYGTHGALLTFGGGHAGYYGSEVYAFDLDTRLWKRVTDPYAGPISWPYTSTSYPDGSPVPPHTYDYVDYHPASNSFVLMRGLQDGYQSTNATSLAITHLLDLDTGKWRRSRQNGSLRLHSGGITCYDQVRDSFWILGASTTTNQFTRFDPNVTNSDGSVGSYTNYPPHGLDIDAAADCDPVHDIFVYTQFRSSDKVYAVDLKNPTATRAVLNQTGDIPEKSHANGWAWSDKRQAFLYWRRGGGLYEFKLVDGDWATGTWRWTLLTSSANTVSPQDMTSDNGVYSRFRVTRWGDEEVAVVVNRVDGPVYAFRVPSGAGQAAPVTVSLTASPRNITAGSSSTLTWSASNAASCTASGAWTGARATSGSQGTGALTKTGLYTLECVSSAGVTGRASVQVAVGTGTESANSSPAISGTPLTSVVAGASYTFLPVASDPDGDVVSFSIANKPDWATFNASTGSLTGTPSAADVGTTSGIVISVSDGQDTRSLAAFNLNVVSQGTYGGTLTWSAPTTSANGEPLDDLAGYKLYIGNAPRSYTRSIRLSNPGVTNYYVDGLTAGTYYFAVTGVDISDNESSPSNEVKAILGTTGGSAGGGSGSGGDSGGTPPPSDGGSTPGTGSSGGISGMSFADLGLLLGCLLIAARRRAEGRAGTGFRRFSEISGVIPMQSKTPAGLALAALAILGAGAADASDADFQARCAAPGVLKCVGFDTPSELAQGVNLYPAWDGQFRGTADTSTKASGNSSLRFEIPPFSAANTSGYSLWDMGQGFGPGTTFYIQFRQRFSQAMLDTRYQSDGWKQVIFHRAGKSCGSVELTTQNTYNRGFPIMYTECGSTSMKETLGGGDYRLEQGDYNCLYSKQPEGCATYRANQWMTFSYRVHVGDWGTPTSSIYAWVAYEGEPLKQFIKRDNFTLNYGDSPSNTYSKIQITPYQSKKDTSQDHPVAYTWYDELIVSTQPIAGPDGEVAQAPEGDSVPPAAPAALQFQP
ncbi:MAG: hypothetical protein J0M16_00520 [Gammaproteobacteria bacterium]|nr:hypothetical protein [Gammaproteobacteria bacterium]